MSLSGSRYRARGAARVATGYVAPALVRGAWVQPALHSAAAPARRFFNRSALTLVAGGAAAGALAMSGALVTGVVVGACSLIAAPFVHP